MVDKHPFAVGVAQGIVRLCSELGLKHRSVIGEAFNAGGIWSEISAGNAVAEKVERGKRKGADIYAYLLALGVPEADPRNIPSRIQAGKGGYRAEVKRAWTTKEVQTFLRNHPPEVCLETLSRHVGRPLTLKSGVETPSTTAPTPQPAPASKQPQKATQESVGVAGRSLEETLGDAGRLFGIGFARAIHDELKALASPPPQPEVKNTSEARGSPRGMRKILEELAQALEPIMAPGAEAARDEFLANCGQQAGTVLPMLDVLTKTASQGREAQLAQQRRARLG